MSAPGGAPAPVILEGVDEIPAALGAIAGGVIGLGAALGLRPMIGLLPSILLGLLAVALGAGARYRLRIGPGGVVLTGLRLWVLPARRQRYALDVELDLYQSFEADEPEGLCLRPPLWSGIAESECFGPHRSQARLAETHARGSAAIAAFRAMAPARSEALRLRLHPELDATCAVLERDPRGVARRARLREEVQLDGIRIPAGSELALNDDAWLAPDSPDALRAITLSAPTPLPVPGLGAAQAGGVLTLDLEGRIRGGRGLATGSVAVEGRTIDGADLLGWDRRGRLERFTLAAPLQVGSLEIPAGSRFSPWVTPFGAGPRDHHVRLDGPLDLPQWTVRGSLVLSADGARVLGAWSDEDRSIEGLTLKGGLLHWPLGEDLRVDLRAARAAGLVRPAG